MSSKIFELVFFIYQSFVWDLKNLKSLKRDGDIRYGEGTGKCYSIRSGDVYGNAIALEADTWIYLCIYLSVYLLSIYYYYYYYVVYNLFIYIFLYLYDFFSNTWYMYLFKNLNFVYVVSIKRNEKKHFSEHTFRMSWSRFIRVNKHRWSDCKECKAMFRKNIY